MTLNCTRDLNDLFSRQIANAFEIETKDCLILYVSYVAIYFSNMFQLSSFSKYSSESGLLGHTYSAIKISIAACHDVISWKSWNLVIFVRWFTLFMVKLSKEKLPKI